MKLLLLSTSMGMGGADQQIISAAEELRLRGWNARIVSMTSLGAMGLQARERGIPVESLNMPRGVPDPRGFGRLAGMVRSWRPDILHSHLVHANLMARLVRLLAPVPVLVSTIHSSKDGGRLLLLGYRLTDRLADCTTIVSRTSIQRYVELGAVRRERLRFIPNGIDTGRFRPLSQAGARLRESLGLAGDTFVWLAVGRFEVAKDYPNMLTAFARAVTQRPDQALLLVGKGSLQAETEKLAASLGLRQRVRFLGVRSDVSELMSAADGYLLSSAWEGMPMVLLEAAATAMPIVATDVGGNGEVVVHEETGYLVPHRAPEALAQAMLRLAALPAEQRRELGRKGRAHIEAHYSLPRIVDRWEELYRELLGRRKARSRPAGQGAWAETGS